MRSDNANSEAATSPGRSQNSEAYRYVATKAILLTIDGREKKVRFVYDRQQNNVLGIERFGYGATRSTGIWMEADFGLSGDIGCHLAELKEAGTFEAFLEQNTLASGDGKDDLPQWASDVIGAYDYDYNVIGF